jgi:hypothetical protein
MKHISAYTHWRFFGKCSIQRNFVTCYIRNYGLAFRYLRNCLVTTVKEINPFPSVMLPLYVRCLVPFGKNQDHCSLLNQTLSGLSCEGFNPHTEQEMLLATPTKLTESLWRCTKQRTVKASFFIRFIEVS